MNFSQSKLAIILAIIAMISCDMICASSYYQQAKDKAAHAYYKTKDKARELYDKATGRAIEGPRVQMESGKMKTSLITTDKAGQNYVTKRTIPASAYDDQEVVLYDQQVVEEQ